MLTAAQITEGTARLDTGRLTAPDVDKLVGVMRMFFSDLETKYSYDWRTKLEELDDTSDDAKTAAQIAACIIKMEELGFGVSSLQGGSDALYYKEKDEYWQYVVIIHTKFYVLPSEFSNYSLSRRSSAGGRSGTAFSTRVEPRGFGISERSARRRSQRRY